MTAIMTQINFISNQEIIDNAKTEGKFYAKKHSEGIEILDKRSLLERMANPVKGKKNVVYYLGLTHFVVSEKYFNEVVSKW